MYITGRRFDRRCGETTDIKVYSNQPRVALVVNGVTFGCLEGETVFVFRNVPMAEEMVIDAVAGAVDDQIVLHRVSEPDAGYVYPKKGQGNRVSNWFRQQKAEVELFPEGRWSISDKIGELLADERAAALLERELPDIVNNPRSRSMGGMTLMRILDYNSDHVTRDQVMQINAMLNEIEKPEGGAV